MADSTTATPVRSTISGARPANRLQARAQFTGVMAAGRIAHWFVRGKKPAVNRDVVLETWNAVSDGAHNSNTDLTFWNGWFYLCHQTSPYHLGSSRSRMLLWRSTDARSWEQVAVFKAETGEYRDPTFGQINGKLYLYLLPNKERNPEPFTTAWSSSADGLNWTPLAEVDHPGWLYWRPKTIDGKTWYVTAYWHEHGKSALLKSPDGEHWEMVSQIFQGERNDETDFEFMADGRILSTARLEGKGGWEGDPSSGTLLATSEPPYKSWSYARSRVTRFDGPCLFPYNGRVYGVGRYQSSFFPRVAEQGGLFSRKRTSLFQLDESGITRLTDLPSAGDTSYAGIAMRGNEAYVSYYTSDVKEDPPWVVGMFQPSAIKMARRLAAGDGAPRREEALGEDRRTRMTEPLTPEELAALQSITTPTVCNAIETFDVRLRNEGFMDSTIQCRFPELGAMVGYAVTITARASVPPEREIPAPQIWAEMDLVPKPWVVVIEDLDYPRPIGSYWGEVNGSVYKALGAVGTVTNGGVRDLPEVRATGFHFFSSCVLVSHAYVHVVEAGGPVTVGGLTVRPGDLLHGDEHGVTSIPFEIARELPKAARELEARERKLIDYARSAEFTKEGLGKRYRQVD